MSVGRLSGTVRHVVLGNPENRRIALFQDALVRHGLAPARVVSYQGLLDGLVSFDTLFQQTDVLRIESPGENFEVEKRLIARGAEHPQLNGCEQISRSDAMALEPDRGRLRFTRQWFLGYCELLQELETYRRQARSVRLYNTPGDIQVMFDKPTCQQYLDQRGVPVAEMLVNVRGYEHLLEQIRDRQWKRVFVKLANGSSASGVVALYVSEQHVRAVTSIELVRQANRTLLYNNLQLKTYTDPTDVRTIVDYLCAESAQVEHWTAKASLAGRTFDLRIVVIGGRPQHTVVRTSSSPMTNLHLGNRRGDLEQLTSRLTARRWSEIQETASQAAHHFPESTYVGVDLLLTPGFRTAKVLELNAFGDLLPGIQFAGEDTYGAEILAQLTQVGWK